jgi:hypothetical protein
MKEGLTKKLGPLPVWAWGLIFGVAGYFVYARYKENSAATSSSSTSTLDPNSIDPNTGLTYGQEEDSALSGMATSGGGGGSSSNGTVTPPTLSQELTDVTSLIASLEAAGLIPTPAPTPTPGTPELTPITVPDPTTPTTPAVPGPQSPPATPPTTNPPPPPIVKGQSGLVPQTPAAQPDTITTHVGGPFYNWYKKVYGTAPPVTVSIHSERYIAWTKGTAAAIAKKIPYGTLTG